MISKVAMSVCALMVATALGPAIIGGMMSAGDGELDDMMTRLCDAVSTVTLTGADTGFDFPITATSAGDRIWLEVRTHSLVLRSTEDVVVAHPITALHLWQWNGSAMRSSAIYQLDQAHCCVVATSGDNLSVSTKWVSVDSSPTLMAFASVS